MIKSKHNVIMIHGYKGSDNNHWFPYIKKELEKLGVDVFIPKMPEDHTPEKWSACLEGLSSKINENTILIGHSLGCPAILDLLPKLNKPVFGTILVGGFGKSFDDDREEAKECFAFVKNPSWKKIRKNSGFLKLISSTDDPEIPVDVSIHLSTMLQTSILFIENAGHFCSDDGYEEFPKLLEYLKTQIYLTYEEFVKLDARIGYIQKVEPVDGADKLLRFEIDFQEGELRQIVSGIREFFPDYESLVGKKALYVLNLEPREIKGVASYGMLMAVDGVDGNPVFLVPESSVSNGSSVR
jgi:methionine--tRNA ligase beta chain